MILRVTSYNKTDNTYLCFDDKGTAYKVNLTAWMDEDHKDPIGHFVEVSDLVPYIYHGTRPRIVNCRQIGSDGKFEKY